MVMCLSQHSFSPISRWLMPAVLAILFAAGAAVAQDPSPQAAPPRPKLLPPPAGAITLGAVSESDLRATIKRTGFLRHAPFAFLVDRSHARHRLRPRSHRGGIQEDRRGFRRAAARGGGPL